MKYTKQDDDMILTLHLSGHYDREIWESLGFGSSHVQKVTSNYWKQKMKSK
jgi:hypothetical protein